MSEPNTDPRFIYADDNNVIAYRLGMVETDLKSMDMKLDKIINEYPTVTTLSLILEPLKEKVLALEKEQKNEAAEKVKNQQQIKYLTYTAIIGPIGMILVGAIIAGLFGVFPK